MDSFHIRHGKVSVAVKYWVKPNRKEDTMEELKKALVTKIGEQLKLDKPNIQYLDVLNRLLGTVSNFLLSEKSKG